MKQLPKSSISDLSWCTIISFTLQVVYLGLHKPVLLVSSIFIVIYAILLCIERRFSFIVFITSFWLRFFVLLPWLVLVCFWFLEKTTWDYCILSTFLCVTLLICIGYEKIRHVHSNGWDFVTVRTPVSGDCRLCFYGHSIFHFFSRTDIFLSNRINTQSVGFQEIERWYQADLVPEIHHVYQFQNIFQIHTARDVSYYYMSVHGEWYRLWNDNKRITTMNSEQDVIDRRTNRFTVFVDIRPFLHEAFIHTTPFPKDVIDNVIVSYV